MSSPRDRALNSLPGDSFGRFGRSFRVRAIGLSPELGVLGIAEMRGAVVRGHRSGTVTMLQGRGAGRRRRIGLRLITMKNLSLSNSKSPLRLFIDFSHWISPRWIRLLKQVAFIFATDLVYPDWFVLLPEFILVYLLEALIAIEIVLRGL